MSRYILFILGLGILITTSCTNEKEKEKKIDSFDVSVEGTKTNDFDLMFSAPSPVEIFSLFEDSELKFNSNLLSNPKNFEEKTSLSSLNTSLGVYMADVAYLNIFNQFELMTSYLDGIFYIADKLNLSGIYNQFDFKKVFSDMNNPDSLELLSNNLFVTITNYMTETDNEKTLCIVYYSSYIELLYLVFNSIDEFDGNLPIIQHITLQSSSLNDLYKFSNKFSDDEDIKVMREDLSKINKVWGECEVVKSETNTSETENGELSIGGGNTLKLTESQFLQLKTTISELRGKIIEQH